LIAQRVGVGRRHAELELLVVDDLQQVLTADLRPGHADVGVGCRGLVVLGELGCLGQRGDEGLVSLGVVLAEFLGGIEHGRRVRAEQLVGVEHHMHVRIFQRLVLERRIGEMPGQLGTAGQQRGGGIRMRQGHGVLVQAVVLVVAPLLGRGVLEEARLHRHAHRRHGDAVLFGEVGDGLDVGVVAHQVVGEVAQRGHTLDVLPALSAVPHGQQRADAGTGDVDGAGQQRIVDRRAAGQLLPLHLDLQAVGLAVLLDQLLVTHHVEQQIDDAELLGDADLPLGMSRLRRGQGTGQQAEGKADAAGQSAKTRNEGKAFA
jgi:hypothetical protein